VTLLTAQFLVGGWVILAALFVLLLFAIGPLTASAVRNRPQAAPVPVGGAAAP
jgi:hypothetical protein